jgi:hypothetical protein
MEVSSGWAQAEREGVQGPSGGELFAGEDDFLHFCSEVDRALDALLDEWGAEGYLEQWIRYRFPQEAHAKLKEAIRREQQNPAT